MGMPVYERKDIERLCAEKDVKFLRLQFMDMMGSLKNVEVPLTQLGKVLDGQIMFDGSSIEGFARIEESDMNLRPDLNTFLTLPWSNGGVTVARLICDIYTRSGEPFDGDPRLALKKQLLRASELGYSVNIGPECEFYLFKTDASGMATTQFADQSGYFDLTPADYTDEVRRDIVLTLEEMGFKVEVAHHECGPSQHELDFKYTNALTAADRVVTLKMVTKQIAKKHGMHATFMPKPVYGIAGSGMHCNISLSKAGENAFYDPNGEFMLSDLARSFVAGLLKHAKAFTPVTNPLVNSYKRLVSGFEAPVYIAWSTANRSVLVRIPTARGASTRVELRNPDPSCNPYMAFATIIASGLDGIVNGLIPPQPCNRNLYSMNEQERLEEGIDTLPGSLKDALLEMDADPVVREALGDVIYPKYRNGRFQEWKLYKQIVHKWELDNYLQNY